MINFEAIGRTGAWFLLVWLVGSCSGSAKPEKSGGSVNWETEEGTEGGAVLAFEDTSHDFGTLLAGEQVVCYFEYENSGGEPLVIRSVETTCGCTTPDWNREPLPPGGKERLQVIFDATGRSGLQLKQVTVVSNASEPRIQLILRAEVKDK